LKKILVLSLLVFLTACSSKNVPEKKIDLVEPKYKTFVEQSYSQYMSHPDEFEDYLYLAVTSGKFESEIIEELNAKTGFETAETSVLISFILQKSEIHKLHYGDKAGRQRLTDQLLERSNQLFALTDYSQAFVRVIIDTWIDTAQCLRPSQLQNIAKRSDGFDTILAHGGLWRRCPDAVAWTYSNYVNTTPIDLYVINETALGKVNKLILSKRLFEDTSLTKDQNTGLYLAALYLNSLYELGYVSEYKNVFDQLSPEQKSQLIAGVEFKNSIDLNGYPYPVEGTKYNFYYEMLSEMIVKGKTSDAESFRQSQFNSQMHSNAFLNSLLAKFSEEDDLFDYFMGTSTKVISGSEKGAFWKLEGEAPGFRILAAKLAIDKGYLDMGTSLINTINLNSKSEGSYQKMWHEVLEPQLKFDNQGGFIARLDKDRVDWLDSIKELLGYQSMLTGDKGGITLFSNARGIYFKERTMPEGEIPSSDARSLSNDITLPVDDWSVVRVEKDEQDVFVVYQNHDVDPVGEVSGGGYWMIHSSNNAVTWSTPVYLGIQANQPYEIVSDSHLSMKHGDIFRIEVKRAEIDPTSITFPPVGLRIQTDSASLYLEYKLTDLYRDSDNDGLTDILEEKLGLNAFAADSDQDGLIDSKDPLPFVKFSAQHNEYSFLLDTIIQKVVGYEEQGIVVNPSDTKPISLPEDRANIDKMYTLFLNGNRDNYSNLQLPVRTIVLSSEEISAIREKWGVFYPINIELFVNKASTKAYVNWSAGWTGGTIIFEKSHKRWKIKDESNWIT
jgi:hypothetical protein